MWVFLNIPLRKQRKNNTPSPFFPFYIHFIMFWKFCLFSLFVLTVKTHAECVCYFCLSKALTQKFYNVTYCDIKTLPFLNKQCQTVTLKLTSVCDVNVPFWKTLWSVWSFPGCNYLSILKHLKCLDIRNFKSAKL